MRLEPGRDSLLDAWTAERAADEFALCSTSYACGVLQASKELSAARTKWQSLADFESCREGWMTSPCSALDPDEVQAKVSVCVLACGAGMYKAKNKQHGIGHCAVGTWCRPG